MDNSKRKNRSGNKRQVRRRRTDVAKLPSTLTRAYGSPYHIRAPFGTWKEIKMEFTQLFNPTILTLTNYSQVFRANSIFDPDLTGTGLQPRFFDQMTPVYNRYRVKSLSWHVEFANTTVSYPCVAGAVSGTVTPTSISDAAETLHVPARLACVGAPAVIFNGKVSLDQLLGRSFQSYHTDDLTQSVVTTNPIETLEFHLFIGNITAATLTPVIAVTLYYDAVFFDPIIPAQS
jgi:hypothetical protein